MCDLPAPCGLRTRRSKCKVERQGMNAMHNPSKVSAALSAMILAIVAASLLLGSAGPLGAQASPTISFGKSVLQNASLPRPTSLQFGPDGRLYVAQQNGTIKVYTVAKNGANSYSATNTQTLNDIRSIPNHNDDGTPMPQDHIDFGKRQ